MSKDPTLVRSICSFRSHYEKIGKSFVDEIAERITTLGLTQAPGSMQEFLRKNYRFKEAAKEKISSQRNAQAAPAKIMNMSSLKPYEKLLIKLLNPFMIWPHLISSQT